VLRALDALKAAGELRNLQSKHWDSTLPIPAKITVAHYYVTPVDSGISRARIPVCAERAGH